MGYRVMTCPNKQDTVTNGNGKGGTRRRLASTGLKILKWEARLYCAGFFVSWFGLYAPTRPGIIANKSSCTVIVATGGLPRQSTIVFVKLLFVALILTFLLALLAHGDAIRNAGGFLDRRSESHVDTVADSNHSVILGILSVLQKFNCGVQHVREGRFRGFLFMTKFPSIGVWFRCRLV